MAVSPRQTGWFPPEVIEDVRRVGRALHPRKLVGAERAELVWLWLLLLLYPFTDYPSTALQPHIGDLAAAALFVVVDASFIVAVLLSRGDTPGARFFGLIVVALDIVYAIREFLLDDVGPVESLVYDVLYTILLLWVLAHIFRAEPVGRLLTAPIVVGAFVGYLSYTLPSFVGNASLERLLHASNGVNYYNAAASVIPVFLIALSLEGGWLTDVEGDTPVARTLRHGLRLVTILVLAIAQAAAIGAMLAGGGSPLAFQITVEAIAVGFTAIFIMLLVEQQH